MNRESNTSSNLDDFSTDSEDSNDLDRCIEEEDLESASERMGIKLYQFEPLIRISAEMVVDSSPES